jgi:hypothetical protein
MRRRITRTLLAASAVAATATTLAFASAGAAGAASTAATVQAPHVINPPSGGPPVYTPRCNQVGGFVTTVDNGGCAGYVASGRDFRFAQSVITVPTVTADRTSPIQFIGLSSADSTAGAGIISCEVATHVFGATCLANTYLAFGLTDTNGVVGPTPHFVPLPGVIAGDGIFFSIYENVAGNQLHFVINLPGAGGTTYAFGDSANGAVYNRALALADWDGTFTGEPPTVMANTRVTQFFQGRFTTVSGAQGTFSGPWALNPVEVTSNGFRPPLGTLLSAPSFLWNDGKSFRGLGGDAFGVWLYSS